MNGCKRRLSPVESVEYARQIADGVAAAHRSGFTHGDLRPENVFITKAGKIKVIDFGLAETIGGEHESWSQRDNREFVRIVSYPKGINSRGSGPAAIWRMRSFFPAWFAFCGLIENYEWFVSTELPSNTQE